MSEDNFYNKPPKWADTLLEWYCREELLEDLQGDLYEHFYRNQEKGRVLANLIYVIDVLKFFRFYTVKKLKTQTKMNRLALLKINFKTSIRVLRRNKLFSAINIIGLAISMSVGLLIISLITEMTGYDDFHTKGDQIYRVVNTIEDVGFSGEFATTSLYVSNELDKRPAGFKNKVILNRRFGGVIDNKERKLPISGFYASKDFFNLFSFELLIGNGQTALASPFTLVLTESYANKLFGDTNPLGKTVKVDDVDFTITGVVADPPKNSHMKFESLASFETYKEEEKDHQSYGKPNRMWRTYIYLQIPDKQAIPTIQSNLNDIAIASNEIDGRRTYEIGLQPLYDIFTGEEKSNQIGPTFPMFMALILSAIAFIIVLAACLNYTNLSVARTLRRTKEIGVRKVLGATKSSLFGQFITEAVIVSLSALLISIGIFSIMRVEFLDIADVSSQLSLQVTWVTVVFFVLFAIVVGIIAGFLPSLIVTKLKSIDAFRQQDNVRLLPGIGLRKALIVFQFTLSIIFILFTVSLFRQYDYTQSKDLGFSTNQIVNMNIFDSDKDLLEHEFSKFPAVQEISFSNSIMHSGNKSIVYGIYDDPLDSAEVNYNSVSEQYLGIHKIELLAGTNFDPAANDELKKKQVIVNEKLLERFGFSGPEEAIHEKLILDEEPYEIIGVTPDFHHNTLDDIIEPYAFRYTPEEFHYANFRISSDDYVELMKQLSATWEAIDPVHPFEATFYDDEIANAYQFLSVLAKFIGFVSLLVISIATMGLIGMSVYEVETRIKEVSIRKVMGASAKSLVLLLSKKFLKLIMIAVLIATPISILGISELFLPEFEYSGPLGAIELTLSAMVVVIFAGLIIALQTIKAANSNPAVTLRNE